MKRLNCKDMIHGKLVSEYEQRFNKEYDLAVEGEGLVQFINVMIS